MNTMLKEINKRIKKAGNKEITKRDLKKEKGIKQGDWVELVNLSNAEARRGKYLVVGLSEDFVYVIKHGDLFENAKNNVYPVPKDIIK